MGKKSLGTILIVLAGGFLLGRYVSIDRSGSDPVRGRAALVQNSPAPQNSPGEAGRGFESVVEVAESVTPSLVSIASVRVVETRRSPFEYFFEEFFDAPERPEEQEPQRYRHEGTGSGFIVDEEGYVLTSYHIVADVEELQVTLYDEETYDAEVVGRDPRTDLAVIKIDADRSFTPLPLGDSDNINIGEAVVAAGSPFGLEQTFTHGIISARRQDVRIGGHHFGEMIQTDASINMGNSGGPLVDMRGRVIGINTAIVAPTGVFAGVGFASPINRAALILDELIEVGRVIRGWLGVEIREVDEAVKEQFDLESEDGALINRVYEDTPAWREGIRRGDVVIEVDEQEIETAGGLQEVVGAFSPGDIVKVTVMREGSRQEFEVELGEMPEE